jgi:hypothetical protein
MILRDQLLSERGWEHIFDHADDEDKLAADRLAAKNPARLKPLTNRGSSDQMGEGKTDHEPNSQAVCRQHIPC